jgi:hypothetical protein
VLVLHYVEVLHLTDFVASAWRPLVSTGIMALVLDQIPRIDGVPLFLQLVLSIGGGAIVYILAVFLLWRISACEEGAESYLLEQTGLKDRVVGWMRIKK